MPYGAASSVELVDVEVHLNLLTPWHLFPFLKGAERVEIAIHSIHYFDAYPGSPWRADRCLRTHHGPSRNRPRPDADLGDPRLWRGCPLHNVDQPQPSLWPQVPGRQHSFGRRSGAAMVKIGVLLNYLVGYSAISGLARRSVLSPTDALVANPSDAPGFLSPSTTGMYPSGTRT